MNAATVDASSLWADLQALRERSPLVHNITNLVVMNMTANALLAIGAGFKGRKVLGYLRPTAVATAVKLMALPALFLPVAVHLGFTDEKLVALLVMLGSIATPSCYVMAKQMGHEGVLTGSVCVTTTLFSAFSLTFWLFLLRSMGCIA